MLYKTIDTSYELRKQFEAYGRDYYSNDGYQFLLDYYGDEYENVELDVVAMCCEWTEYNDYNDLINDYGNLVDDDDDDDEDGYIDRLLRELDEYTYYQVLGNGNIMVAEF